MSKIQNFVFQLALKLNIAQGLLNYRVNNLLKENDIKWDGYDEIIADLLKQAGVTLSASVEVKKLLEDASRILNISVEKWDELVEMGKDLSSDLDLSFAHWVESDDEVEILDTNVYGVTGSSYENPEYQVRGKGKSKRTVLASETFFLKWKGRPVVLKRRAYGKTERWGVTVWAEEDIAQQFMLKIMQIDEEYIVVKYKGKVITPFLDDVELQTYEEGDLVFSPKLQTIMNKMIKTFLTWALPETKVVRWGHMLFGRPGTGKTTAVMAMLSERPEDVTVIYAPAAESDSTTTIRYIFHLARILAPTVIVIDDIDLIAPDRQEGGSTTAALMEELNGGTAQAQIMVCTTTNSPKGIDPAIRRRAGRIANVYEWDGYEEVVSDIISNWLAKFEIEIGEEDFNEGIKETSELTKDFTPDECKNVAERLYLEHADSKQIDKETLVAAITETHECFYLAQEKFGLLKQKE